MAMSGYVVHGVERNGSRLCGSSTAGSEGGEFGSLFPPMRVTRSQWTDMTCPAISGVAIDTLLLSCIGLPLFHCAGTHATFRGAYIKCLHAFLDEMDEEWLRRHHRRRAQEMVARMSLASGRDSTDGSADVTDRPTDARRMGSRAQRQRKSLPGAGSSCVSDMVSLPPAEASTVQALMDFHHFYTLQDWGLGLSRYTRRGQRRLIRQRRRLQVVWTLVVKKTEWGLRRRILTWMGCPHPTMILAHRLASMIFRLPCCVVPMKCFPRLIPIRSSWTWIFPRSRCRQDAPPDVLLVDPLRYVGRADLGSPSHGFPG